MGMAIREPFVTSSSSLGLINQLINQSLEQTNTQTTKRVHVNNMVLRIIYINILLAEKGIHAIIKIIIKPNLYLYLTILQKKSSSLGDLFGSWNCWNYS